MKIATSTLMGLLRLVVSANTNKPAGFGEKPIIVFLKIPPSTTEGYKQKQELWP